MTLSGPLVSLSNVSAVDTARLKASLGDENLPGLQRWLITYTDTHKSSHVKGLYCHTTHIRSGGFPMQAAPRLCMRSIP